MKTPQTPCETGNERLYSSSSLNYHRIRGAMAKQMTAFISGFSCVVFLLGTHSFRYDPCQSSPCGLCPCTFLKNHYRCEPCSSISTSTTMKTVFTDFTTPHRNETRNVTCLNLSNNDPLFQNCGHQGLNPQDNSNTICTRLAKLSQLCEKENGILTLQNIGNSSLITENLTSGLTTGEKAKLVTFYMQFVEATVLKAASEDVKGGNQSVTGPFMAFETLRLAKDFICKPENEPFTLKAEKQTMEIHCTTIQDSLGDVVAFISYADIGRILNKDFVSEEHLKAEEQLDTFFLNSKVVSGVLQSTKNGLLANPVNFTFQHEQVKKDNEKPLCVYWQGSSWSNEGCQVIASDENQTVCSCTHLSSFAILMASTTLKDDPVLTLITYVGLSLSLLCLLLAILTFLRCRPIQNTSTSLHLQLSLCLFLAYLLFLTGINRTKPKVLCSIIAGALHYLYLAAFTWMLLEGLQLFLTVRNLKVANYLSARNFKKKFVYPFGYGIPAVIVAVSAGIGPSNYGTHTHCWLNLRTGFIWTFTGPVSVIILINLSFYLTTLWILRDQLSSLNDEVSRIQNTRLLTFKAIAQLFILGCSWGLGFFLIETIQEPARSVIAYSFTIINVLQGFYIFLVHCLLNHKVREEYKLWFKKRRKSTKTESYDLSGSTTQTKTMEKTTDFSGKTSKISWEK